MKEFPYKLRLNMRALVRFEDETGQNLFYALGIDQEALAKAKKKALKVDTDGADDEEAMFDISTLRFSIIASIVWAGRLHETPDLTPEKNLNDIADIDPMEIFSAVCDSIGESMTNADESENPKAPSKGKKTA